MSNTPRRRPVVTIALTAQEWIEFKRKARENETNPSAYARLLVLRDLGREKTQAIQP